MPGRPIDKSHDEDVARLHAEGRGRNDIARDLNLPNGTVSNIAKRLRLKFDGSQVVMATEVRRREAAERRAILTVALLEDCERLRIKMWRKTKYIQYGGKDFVRVEDTYQTPLPNDQAAIARSIGILLDRAVKLDDYDKTGATLEDAYGVQIVIRGQVHPVDEASRIIEQAEDAGDN
jgi:hypothetical protein